jgi:hypothetical protein
MSPLNRRVISFCPLPVLVHQQVRGDRQQLGLRLYLRASKHHQAHGTGSKVWWVRSSAFPLERSR